MSTLPAGTVGFSRPAPGWHGIVGRIIAARQGLLWRAPTLPGHTKPGAVSHVRVALGDGHVFESTWPQAKITTEAEANAAPGGVVWYAPPPLRVDEAARLRLGAIRRIGRSYSLWSLVRFIITGTLGPGSFVCTTAVAELYHEASDVDVSGCGQPWNVDLRTWFTWVNAAGWTRL